MVAPGVWADEGPLEPYQPKVRYCGWLVTERAAPRAAALPPQRTEEAAERSRRWNKGRR